MPSISVSVAQNDVVFPCDLPDTATLKDLRSSITTQAGLSDDSYLIMNNGQVVRHDARNIQEAGIKEGDLLEVIISSEAQPTQAPPAQPVDDDDAQLESLRQSLLQNVGARNQLITQIPTIHELVRDRQRFADLMRESMQASKAKNNRQQKIDQQMQDTMEEFPEMFGRVTMLYINVEVNGTPVKAFVDSGAQATILSPSCAEKCGIMDMIDPRFGGVARGVGTAKILGRIHKAMVKIGYDEIPCSFTVMEGKDVDMLFGLDMLKRYQASIDLNKNMLVFPGGQSVPFLPESELPNNFEEEPTVEGPDGTRIGAKSGQPLSAGSIAPSATSGPSSGGNNFGGQGRTLGNVVPVPPSAQTPGAQPQPDTSATPASTQSSIPAGVPSEEAIATLMDAVGASREQAIDALQRSGGNIEYAASMLF